MDESAHQQRLLRTVRAHAAAALDGLPRMPELAYFHSVPNSTRTTRGQAAKMVREGATEGVHDLHCDLCRGGYTGLTIEMKAEGKTLTAPQKAFAKFYGSQGILSVRCKTDAEAWDVISWYYCLPPTPLCALVPLPPGLLGMAAPTEHRVQDPAARLAANAKRRRTLMAKCQAEGAGRMAAAQSAVAARPPIVKYPVRG